MTAILFIPVFFFPISDAFGTAKLVYLTVFAVVAGYRLWRMDGVRIPYPIPLLAYLIGVAASSVNVVNWYQFILTTGTDLAGITIMVYMANADLDPKRLMRAIALVALIFSGFAAALALIPIPLYAGRPEWAWESTMGNTGFAGGMIAAMIPVVGWLAWKENRPWMWLTLALMVIHLDFTRSRTSYVSLALVGVIALVIGVARRRVRPIRVILAALGLLTLATIVISFLFATQAHRLGSSQVRLMYWQGTSAIIADNPVLGAGRGQFQVVALPYMSAAGDPGLYFVDHAHNDYLELLAETGPLGLLGMLGVMGMVMWRSLKDPPWRFALGCAYLTLIFNALTFFPLHTVAQAAYFWAYAGLIARDA